LSFATPRTCGHARHQKRDGAQGSARQASERGQHWSCR
jgi:hypothetical protein